MGGLELAAPPVVIRGTSWAYRQRTQVQVQRDAGRTRVGYHERRSRQLVAVERCPVLVPELEQALLDLPAALGDDPPSRVDLLAAAGQVTSAPPVGDVGTGEVSISCGGLDYALDARCFFQGHAGLLDELVEEAVGGDEEGALAVDLYAGVGLFSLPLASRYRRVVAVEGERIAARFARNNARRNRLTNVEVVAQAVESWVVGFEAEVDRAVVDPPRAGLAPAVRRHLVERPPRRVTYVSCHAATLARDLQQLLRVFTLSRLALLDLFPQTGHLEAVVQLVRR